MKSSVTEEGCRQNTSHETSSHTQITLCTRTAWLKVSQSSVLKILTPIHTCHPCLMSVLRSSRDSVLPHCCFPLPPFRVRLVQHHRAITLRRSHGMRSTVVDWSHPHLSQKKGHRASECRKRQKGVGAGKSKCAKKSDGKGAGKGKKVFEGKCFK